MKEYFTAVILIVSFGISQFQVALAGKGGSGGTTSIALPESGKVGMMNHGIKFSITDLGENGRQIVFKGQVVARSAYKAKVNLTWWPTSVVEQAQLLAAKDVERGSVSSDWYRVLGELKDKVNYSGVTTVGAPGDLIYQVHSMKNGYRTLHDVAVSPYEMNETLWDATFNSGAARMLGDVYTRPGAYGIRVVK